MKVFPYCKIIAKMLILWLPTTFELSHCAVGPDNHPMVGTIPGQNQDILREIFVSL